MLLSLEKCPKTLTPSQENIGLCSFPQVFFDFAVKTFQALLKKDGFISHVNRSIIGYFYQHKLNTSQF
jgi:hypothetical protein